MAATQTAAEPVATKTRPQKSWIWIIYNEERRRTLVLRGTSPMAPGPRIDLMPGANRVDAALWERWKRENDDQLLEDESVMAGQASALLKGKIPDAGHRSRSSEAVGKPYLVEGPAITRYESPIAELRPAEAIAMVDELRDVTLLRSMLVVERRSDVAEVLRARCESIAKAEQQTATFA
jgi:hypothetical protein